MNLQNLKFANVRILQTFVNNLKKFAEVHHTLFMSSKHCTVKMVTHCRYHQCMEVASYTKGDD